MKRTVRLSVGAEHLYDDVSFLVQLHYIFHIRTYPEPKLLHDNPETKYDTKCSLSGGLP